MARLAAQSQTAASGMNLTSDPVSMSLSRARRLVNFQLSRSGRVDTNVRLVDALPSPGSQGPIDGVGWYYQAAIRNNPFSTDTFLSDLMLWVSKGFLFAAQASSDPLAALASGVTFIGGGITGYASQFGVFFPRKRVRFFALDSEVLMVQDGGLLMLRVYFSPTLGQGFFRAGFEPPSISNITLSIDGVGVGLTGTWGYKITYADERFRESSPTPVANITLANQATHVVSSNIGTFSPPASYGGSNYRYVYLYRNTIGAPDVFYQIARHDLPSTNPASIAFGANDFYANANPYDNATDAEIINPGLIGPAPGENDPPLPASIGVVHKNRIFLNDINDPNTLQVSNQGSATQFAALSVFPTDGGRFEIGTDQGNSITALVEFGSILAIFKRRGSYFLYGDNLSDFVVRPVHQRGCIAPDSAYRCDNVVCFLSDDGVYAAAYEGGDVVSKISKEIETDLLDQSIEDREASIGWFVDNRYHLSVGPITYVYDFDAQGWTCYQFGSGQISLGGAIPDTTVTAQVGFSPMGNSALYGSIVPGEGPCGDDVLCDIRVTPLSIHSTIDGGVYTLDIVALNMARYGYIVSSGWFRVSDAVTVGSGAATVTVDPNAGCDARAGTITVCDVVVDVTQDGVDCSGGGGGGCTAVVSPLSFPSLSSESHDLILDVTFGSVVNQASTDVPWLHPQQYIPTGFPGSLTGTIEVLVDAAPACTAQTGHVFVCDQTVTFTQPFSITFVPPAVVVSGAAQYVSVTPVGSNFVGTIFTLSSRGKYNSRADDALELSAIGQLFPPWRWNATVVFGVPGNDLYPPPSFGAPIPNPIGETMIYTVQDCDGSVFTIEQAPSCDSIILAGDGAEAIQRQDIHGTCILFDYGPHMSSIAIPVWDPQYPDFGTAFWSRPYATAQTLAPVGNWTVTTPGGHTTSFLGTDPGPFPLSGSQLAEVLAIKNSGVPANFGVIINIFGIQGRCVGGAVPPNCCTFNPIGATTLTLSC